MTTIFATETRAPDFERYRVQWESALLAQTLARTVNLEDPDQKELLRAWVNGLFNGAAFGIEDERAGSGFLDWRMSGPTQIDLIYHSAHGITCSLARVYQQPNGTWGAMVIAGVKDGPSEAMAAAEWAIARLSS
jgi:hypothetical protein